MDKYKLIKIGEELYGSWGWQTRLSEEIGVNISTIKRWLSGATPVPPPVKLALQYLILKKRKPKVDYKSIENFVEGR